MIERNPFGLAYESRLVGALLRDNHFFHSFLAIFDEKYFVSEIHGTTVRMLKGFRELYNRPPDELELQIVTNEYLSQEYPADKAAQELALFVYEIAAYWKHTTSELEFVKDTALRYIKQKACELAVLESAKLIGTPNDYKMPELLQQALAVGTKLTDFGRDYFAERRERALKRYSAPRETNRLPFFLPKFDEIIGGVGYRRDGNGIPELLMFGGSEGRGKSRCIAHMVKVAMSLGGHGMIFSSEIAEDLYTERLDMGLGLLDTAELYDPNNFDRLQRRLEMYANQGARVFVKKFPAGTTTIRETLAIARLVESTLGIDLMWVAWDYTGEFKAENTKAERRDQMAEIVRMQKTAVDELECAGIGAFQLNRDGSRQEMAQIQHAAEDITVARVADTIVIIGQTDEEYEAKEMRWCARKVRAQEKNQVVRLIDDRNHMRFVQHPDEVMPGQAP